MIAIILVIILIVLWEKYNNIKLENENLKKQVENEFHFCPKCGTKLQEMNFAFKNETNQAPPQPAYQSFEPTQTVTQTISQPVTQIKKEKNKYTDKEIKNSLTLIVGSILLILSAILLLTTTWDITNNLLKTVILLIMLFIFLAASFIADKSLHLKQTSQAFYYISLAYIPIILLSIFLFKLFGEYFSVNGEGKYLYLAISSLFVTILYYWNANKKEGTLLKAATIIFSVISIIFIASCISTTYTWILTAITFYTLILNYLYNAKKYFFNEEIHSKSLVTLVIGLCILTFGNFAASLINVQVFDIILELVLFVMILYYSKGKIQSSLFFDIFISSYIVFIFFHMSYLCDPYIGKQLLIIVSVCLVCIYHLLTKKNLPLFAFLESLVILLFLYVHTLSNAWIEPNIIPGYIIWIIITVICLIHYWLSTKQEKYQPILFSIALSLLFYNAANELDIARLPLTYLYLVEIICGSWIVKDTYIRKSFNTLGHILFLLVSITLLENITIGLLIAQLGYTLLCFIQHLTEKKGIYKVLSYLYGHLFMICLLSYYHIATFDNTVKLFAITTMILMLTEYFIPKLKDNTNHYYLTSQTCFTFLLLIFAKSTTENLILLLILGTIFIWYMKEHKMNINWLYLPLLSLIPYIYIKDIGDIKYYLSIASLLTYSGLIYSKKKNIFIIIFYIYFCFHIITVQESYYISLLFLFMGTLASFLIKEGKPKYIYKGILFTIGLLFVNQIIYDLNINTISIFRHGPYLIWIPLLTRLCIKKHSNSYKGWEYFGYIIMNLIALSSYKDEADGILFVAFLTGIVIISYSLKYGPIFLVSLFSILLNAFLLTREFWFSLPWWLYLLIIGVVLISFAVHNEINEKKENTLIKKLQDDLDI